MYLPEGHKTQGTLQTTGTVRECYPSWTSGIRPAVPRDQWAGLFVLLLQFLVPGMWPWGMSPLAGGMGWLGDLGTPPLLPG